MAHLEAIRGLASLQVLALHVFSAFLPGLVVRLAADTAAAHIHRSPLFFLYDGYSAVFIFFALSGLVLTFAFERQSEGPCALLAARVVRLATPAIAACSLAYIIKALVGNPNIAAGHSTGSSWLSGQWLPPSGIIFFMKDSILNSLLLGYDDTSIFKFIGLSQILDPIAWAYVGPLWTLSVELHGSLLVLFLVFAREKSRFLWWMVLSASALTFLRTYYLGFVLGHLVATFGHNPQQQRQRWIPTFPVLVAVAVGVLLCVSGEGYRLSFFDYVCDARIPVMFPCTHYPEKLVGALLIFVAAIHHRRTVAALSSRRIAFLGRLSFSIYLVHYPLIFGIASLILNLFAPDQATLTCRAVVSVVALTVSIAAAGLFLPVDTFAISLGRRVRARGGRTLVWKRRLPRSPV